MTVADLSAVAALLVLTIGACLVVVVDLVARPRATLLAWLGAVIGIAAAATAALVGSGAPGFGGGIVRDPATVFFTVLIGTVTAAALLVSPGALRRDALPAGEYVSLLLFSAAGGTLMVASGDLLVLFLGLELLSLPLYVLTAMLRAKEHGDEGALKYFLLGAAASAVLLYGIALLYAATGTLRLEAIGRATADPLYLAGLALLLGGLAFKAALVPFHAWAPDAYESAPTPVTAQMAVVAKVAAFVAILRLVAATGRAPLARVDWQVALAVLAAATLVVATFSALGQRSVKRLLAYSSIAHAGYLAIGAAATGATAGPAVAFYLAVYAALTFGAFAVLSQLSSDDPTVADLAGLWRRRPLLVVALAVFLFGLTGLPPTAGFLAKVYVFEAALRAQLLWLVVLGVLASVVSAAYYLRVLFACLAQGDGGTEPTPRARVATGVIVLTAALIVLVSFVPQPLLDAAALVRF
ncbi:MAG TPA: NADH-quinone oxidoreductase subunit N [Candidatus Saccharimonadales bacterium]|nr:NADH-quinone oxidoreductase subunit N [Candidatus Saccharimonadales bacterium]